MRRFTISDLVAVCRTLMTIPEAEWDLTMKSLFQEAHKGAIEWAETGKPHPNHGDGTLQSAASHLPKAFGVDFSDGRFRKCAIRVLAYLNNHTK